MAGKLEDLKSQLELTESLNKALEKQIGLQKALSAGVSKQAQLMQSMGKAASKGSGLEKRISDQRKLTQEIENTKKKSSDMTNELQRGMAESAKGVGGFQSALGGVSKFLMSWKGLTLGLFGGLVGGVAKMFSGLTGMIKGVFSIITSVVKTSMGVIKALIMAPFKLMDAFAGMANELKRIQVVINGARQAVRGMVGDHQTHGAVASKAYKNAGAAIKGYGAGVFSAHEQGTAERMKDRAATMQFFGDYKDQMTKTNVVAIKYAGLMRRSIGMSSEDGASLIAMGKAQGENINTSFKEITVGLGSMALSTGINIKKLGKNFMTFANKLKPATGMSNTRLLTLTRTFSKLGMSADKALSMFDKFETLEGGAEVVSKMSRTLGVQLSQTDMIMARGDPLKQMKLVQDALRRSGKSFEDFSYDGKKQLTELFGGDQQATMKAFSAAGLDATDSIDEAMSAMAKNKKANDMPTIMKSLRNSIEGVADSFGEIMKPLKAFMHGFMRGFGGGSLVDGMKIVSKAFENAGIAFGKFFNKSGMMDKLVDTMSTFAVKVTEVMPLVIELISNLFTDQPQSKRSAMTIVSEIASELLGAYAGFYDSLAMMVLKAAQKVVPIMIKLAAFVGEALNNTLTGALTGDWSGLKGQFSGMTEGVDFGTAELNKEWNTLGDKASTTFNDSFMKKQKRYIATNGKMEMRRAGLGEALIDNLGEAIKVGFKKLGSIIWEGIKSAFDNIPTAVKLYIGLALATLFMPGGAIMVAVGTAIGVGLAKATNAIGDVLSDKNAIKSAKKFSDQTRKEIVQRGEDLRLDVANKVAATKGLIKEMKKLLDQEITTKSGKSALEKGMQILDDNAKGVSTAESKRKKSQIDNITAGLKVAYLPYMKSMRGKGAGGSKDFTITDDVFQTQTLKTGGGKEFEGNIRELIGQARVGNDTAIAKLGGILKQGGYRGWKLNEIKDATAGLDINDGNIEIETGEENLLFQHLIQSQATISREVSDAASAAEKNIKTDQTDQLVETFKGLRFVERQAMIMAAHEANKSGNKDEKAKALELMKVLNKAETPTDQVGNIIETLANAELQKLEKLSPDSQFMQGIIRQANAAENPMEEYNKLLKAEAERRATQYAFDLDNKVGGELDKNIIRDLATAAELYTKYMKNPEKLLMEDAAASRAIDAVIKGGGDVSMKGDFIKRLSKQVGGGPLKKQLQKLRVGPEKDQKLKTPKTPPGTKKLMAKAAGAGSKVKGVKVKPVKKAKALGRLPASVLKLLASTRTSKRMFDAGLEMTAVMDKLAPAAKTTSEALNSAAVPALQATADASRQATSGLATTVVMLSLVTDKMLEVQKAYAGIVESVVKVRKEAGKLKGNHSAKITTETGTLEVNIHVNVDSKQISQALEKTPVVTWSGDMGSQG